MSLNLRSMIEDSLSCEIIGRFLLILVVVSGWTVMNDQAMKYLLTISSVKYILDFFLILKRSKRIFYS